MKSFIDMLDKNKRQEYYSEIDKDYKSTEEENVIFDEWNNKRKGGGNDMDRNDLLEIRGMLKDLLVVADRITARCEHVQELLAKDEELINDIQGVLNKLKEDKEDDR